jgi:hypothetical protein
MWKRSSHGFVFVSCRANMSDACALAVMVEWRAENSATCSHLGWPSSDMFINFQTNNEELDMTWKGFSRFQDITFKREESNPIAFGFKVPSLVMASFCRGEWAGVSAGSKRSSSRWQPSYIDRETWAHLSGKLNLRTRSASLRNITASTRIELRIFEQLSFCFSNLKWIATWTSLIVSELVTSFFKTIVKTKMEKFILIWAIEWYFFWGLNSSFYCGKGVLIWNFGL